MRTRHHEFCRTLLQLQRGSLQGFALGAKFFFPIFWFLFPYFFGFWRFGGARLIPVTVDTFDMPKRHEKPKTMTVSRMATPTRPILVTVDTFDTPKRYEKPKTITVSRMATPTRPIPVTVDTFGHAKKI